MAKTGKQRLSEDDIYTIYAFKDPLWKKNRKGYFYIGVTRGNVKLRVIDHRSDARNGHKSLKFIHMRKMWDEGRDFEVITLYEGIRDRAEAFALESRTIEEYGYETLLNMTMDVHSDLFKQQQAQKKGTRDDGDKYGSGKKEERVPKEKGYKDGDYVPKRKS